MRICPYISFNGNCAEAVAFYEEAFNVKAEIMRYKDAPPEDGYQTPEGAENLVMHAQFEVGGWVIMLCDMPPGHPAEIGDNIAVMTEFDNADMVRKVFDALKEGGEVSMEIQDTFWSNCFCSLTDKFGINWNISTGCPYTPPGTPPSPPNLYAPGYVQQPAQPLNPYASGYAQQQQNSYAPPPPLNPPRRKVKKAKVATIIVCVILMIAILFVALFFGIASIIENHPSYHVATDYIIANSEIVEIIGEIEGFGFMPTVSFYVSPSYGYVDYIIVAQGAHGNVRVFVELQRHGGGDWEIVLFSFVQI